MFQTISSILFALILLVAYWKVYVKANEPGWKCLIPFYCTYIKYKIAGKKKLGIASLVLSVLSTLFGLIMIPAAGIALYGSMSPKNLPTSATLGVSSILILSALIVVAIAITALVFHIIWCSAISGAFGHRAGFAVGLFFLPSLFILILGFGKSEYVLNESDDEASCKVDGPTDI